MLVIVMKKKIYWGFMCLKHSSYERDIAQILFSLMVVNILVHAIIKYMVMSFENIS